MRYTFKDRYTDYQGVDVERIFPTKFYAYAGTGTAATRQNPSLSTGTIAYTTDLSIILGGGFHKLSVGTTGTSINSNRCRIIGNGMKKSIIDAILYEGHQTSGGTFEGVWLKDVTVKNVITYRLGYNGQGTYNNRYYQCEMLSMPGTTNPGVGIINNYDRCIFRVNPSSGNINGNNSFVGISTTIGSIAGNLHTWEKCNLVVNQASLDSYKNNYYAFDNCNFRIGSETDYIPLTGTTAEELRNAFVARCTAAGLSVPADITDYGITLTLGRWLFTKNQVFEGITWAGSEVNQFEILRFISFGYSTSRGTRIPITASNNVPASFAPGNPHSDGLDIADDSLSIDKTVDITQRKNMYLDSKIVWLGGKKKLTKIDIPNDLPYQYGVLIDSIPDLLCDSGQEVLSGSIEPGEMYMLRSSDENTASVTYGGSTYSSVLSSRNNIFKGVAGVTTFTVASGNPVVYKINDILSYQSVQMRIVNKIPDGNIVSGNLQVDYWYLAEHDNDQKNTTDYVTYSGVNYKAGDSFTVKPGVLTFTRSGNIHLRRCWKQDFDFNTETTDKTFWQNEQKPEWCDVLPEDPRCLMKDNHILSFEMARGKDGKYISSGHPEYYNNISGASGVLSPDDIYISGAYMQIRLPITTVNPM
ncbi:hypothetical protein [Dysgonomonas termitidis]|uniref:Uncharacterized protein n=1 Tax=Dysgonomonas termitidis TaxID=1516126 RepID=A0ABV9KQ83_9BACT